MKLTVKLSLLLISLTFLTISGAVIITHLSLDREFEGYLKKKETSRTEAILSMLKERYLEGSQWQTAHLQDLCVVMGACLQLKNQEGKPILLCNHPAHKKALEEGSISPHPIRVNGSTVGTAYIIPSDPLGFWDEDAVKLKSAINGSIFLAGGGAVVVAVALSFFISSLFLSPMNRIAEAARKMGEGNLQATVDFSSNDEAGVVARAFNEMAERIALQESLRRKLTQDLAHEIRTPLTNLQIHLEAFSDGVLTPTPDQLSSLHDEVIRLSKLVCNLEQLSWAESQRIRLEKKPLFLRDVVTKALAGVKPLFQEKGLTWILKDDGTEGGTQRIPGDEGVLVRLFHNLLHNAGKFSSPGGIVTIRITRHNHGVMATIQDQGPGIEPAHLSHIFERFYTQNPAAGSGIGLSIAKELAESHGGTISVESSLSHGSTFSVFLPSS